MVSEPEDFYGRDANVTVFVIQRALESLQRSRRRNLRKSGDACEPQLRRSVLDRICKRRNRGARFHRAGSPYRLERDHLIVARDELYQRGGVTGCKLRRSALEQRAKLRVSALADPPKHRLERLRFQLAEKLVQVVLRRPERSFLECFEKLLEYFLVAEPVGKLKQTLALIQEFIVRSIGGVARFPEQVHIRIVIARRFQYLDRETALERAVIGQENRPHASTPELAFNSILAETGTGLKRRKSQIGLGYCRPELTCHGDAGLR